MKLFDGRFGRTGTIRVEFVKCTVCERPATCVVIDSSEGEYNAGAVCARCSVQLFAQGVDPPLTDRPDFHGDEL